MARNPSIIVALILFSLCIATNSAWAVNNVGGKLVTLSDTPTSPNGAWSWFEDERAIIDDSDPNNTLLLVSSVSAGGGSEGGDVDLLWLNVDTGVKGEFELHNQLQQDDHNSAALWIRPDGRYVAAYGRHGGDDFMRWRISTNPGDPASWSASQSLDVSPGSGANATYNNLHYLPADNGGAGRLYNFTRTINFDPNVVTSDDLGQTWQYRGKLLTQGGSSTRPYMRYFSDGDRIHLIGTEGHPRNEPNNSIYHGYIQDGVLYNSTGSVVDGNLFDAAGQSPTQLTSIFQSGTVVDGTTMQRGWTIDVSIDSEGDPVAVFTMRAEDNDEDHRFFYGAFKNGNWNVNQVAKAGGFLYAPENDYTGLVSIDPDDASTLYVSTPIDPRTDTQMSHYEIFRGQTTDGGENWEWAPITFNSTVDNLRPLVPEWNSSETALVWMRGTYNTFTSWDTEVVALTDITPLDTGPFGDLNANGTLDVGDYAILLRNLNQDLSALAPEETGALGDLNGDLLTDFYDLVLFRNAYDQANGAGSFATLGNLVPEPNSAMLLFLLVSSVVWGVGSRGSSPRSAGIDV